MRLTDEQFRNIVARPGYAIASSLGGPRALPKLECDTNDEPLETNSHEEAYSGRRVVRYRIYRKRLLDPENLATKFYTDALRYAGILKDDRQQDIKLVIEDQIQVKTDQEERVEITIERLEE